MLTNARRRLAQLRSRHADGLLIGDAPATERRRALGVAAVCVLATVAIAQLLAPSATKSATQTFVVSADSYVSEGNPDAVHGDWDYLMVDGGPQEHTSYLRVADLNTEYYDAEMRAPLLQRIANETGGRFYRPANAKTLPEDVALSKHGVTVVNQMDLWDMPAIFLLLVALVSSEWAYRKARGLA